MKNLVTEQGVPIGVNPVVIKNAMADAKLDMAIRVGIDELALQKKKVD